MGLREGPGCQHWRMACAGTVGMQRSLRRAMTDSDPRWITPSIFQAFPGHDTVDEWTLCQNHPDTAPGILKNHWDNWVALSDFQIIANAGFNTVRIPVGCKSASVEPHPLSTDSLQTGHFRISTTPTFRVQHHILTRPSHGQDRPA